MQQQEEARALVASAEAEMRRLIELFGEPDRDAEWAAYVMRHAHELLRASVNLQTVLNPSDEFAQAAKAGLAAIDAE